MLDSQVLGGLRSLRDAVEAAAPGVIAVPARIFGGKRWAALPEIPPSGELPLAASHRIPLGPAFGLILYGWSALPAETRRQVERICAAGL